MNKKTDLQINKKLFLKKLFKKNRNKSNKNQPGQMTLMGHLTELRNRLIICLIVVFVTSVIGFFLWNPVLDFTTAPYCDIQKSRGITQGINGSSCQLYISNPLELFTTRITIGTYIGLFIAAPVILWNLWKFITPALESKEKRYAIPFVISAFTLFVLGATTAWFSFPKALQFFLTVGGDHVFTLFNPGPYLKLIFLLMLSFGLVFQLPILLVFLQLAGVVNSLQLRSFRRYAIISIFVIAAFVTPGSDPYSLFMMAIPMTILYEVAIIIGRLFKK